MNTLKLILLKKGFQIIIINHLNITLMKKVNISLAFLGILVVLLCMSFTKSNKKVIADNMMKHIVEETGAVGLAVAVVKDGEIIFSNTYGQRELSKNTVIAQDDLFRIASISKSFTTTALMSLIEKGKLSLDADVSDLIGFEVRNPNFPDVPITLSMLLSHTSSLNDSQGYFSLDFLNPSSNPESSKCYNNYKPGSAYEYCNLGFNTVGAIVEKYAGKRFDLYIAETIIDPMGLYAGFNVNSLDTNRFVPLYSYNMADSITGEVAGFKLSSSAYAPRSAEINSNYVIGYSTPIFSPTGGMKISARDLARYMTMHMYYGVDPITHNRIISKESALLMQKPAIETSPGEYYGFALLTTEKLIPGETMVGHTGSAYGLFSAMFFEPEKKFGIVMITNGYNPVYDNDYTVLQRKVINSLYDVLIK